MSEVQSRPSGSRGRGSYRGGRGGFRGGRGGTKNHKSEDQENVPPAPIEDQGEVGELKRKFGSKVSTLKELFPEWSDEDLVYALKETDGDLESTIDRMSSGSISQWQPAADVKRKQPKAKESHSLVNETSGASRGGRGRGAIEGRGRGRGADRGRGGRGGRGTTATNGVRGTVKAAKAAGDGWGDTSAPAADTTNPWANSGSSTWDAPANGDIAATVATGDWANDSSNQAPLPTPPDEPKTDAIPAGKVSGWSKLFAKPAPVAAPAPKSVPASLSASEPEKPQPELATQDLAAEELLPPPPAGLVSLGGSGSVNEPPDVPRSDPQITLTPSKDELTETNLEQLPDISLPPNTLTAASTTASTQDPNSVPVNTTPAIRPGMSGYAASALKATSGAGRSASFQRRVMEQQEAVVMPGNHAVDRAAVQFGSMGLNGSGDDLDVDEDREEPETRTQLPDDSPVAPRASLPPPPPTAQALSEATSTQRQAPGLPPVAQQQSTSPPQTSAYADQFTRYAQAGQKAYDPFGQQHGQQQVAQPSTQEPFGSQAPSQSQQISSSAPSDYSSFYNANQQRDAAAAAAAYQNYYGGYGQTQEAQQRSGSTFGTSSQEVQSQYATSRPQAAYSQHDAQNSGSNTPNPAVPTQQSQQSQHMQQGQSAPSGYPYGYPNAYSQQYPQYGGSYMNQMSGQQHRYGQHRPMFDDVRRQNDDYYMTQNNQYAGYGHGQQYGGAPYNKSNMYNQPQHQYSYEHSSSPANAGGFSQTSLGGRESMYGRTGSAQPSEAQQTAGNNAFGGMADPFGRSHSGFGGQAQPAAQQHSSQQASGDDPAKAYDVSKTGGPSPSISQANRPGSANLPGQQQQAGQSSSFPPPQSQQGAQSAFGGYPQYGGLSSFSGHHQGQNSHHQNSGYGNYGSGAGFGSYGGYGSGRGWNGNYGATH